QAEDGIRDKLVTGVQTCALPICGRCRLMALVAALVWAIHPVQSAAVAYVSGVADPLAVTFGFLGLFLLLRASLTLGPRELPLLRSEERRVGKECRSWVSTYRYAK